MRVKDCQKKKTKCLGFGVDGLENTSRFECIKIAAGVVEGVRRMMLYAFFADAVLLYLWTVYVGGGAEKEERERERVGGREGGAF